ncbi:hypothetical protein BRADI_2g01135v3 [Brachypodium distachyon]|uniref:Uncharacterized protein n=1 Tax=Brachypodium distachyon TaxID=15368 RepID=A0A0Q3I9A1_BRADI|nr:hypothetical protein BRADI_2g01135v3 [Brachypodium distachyon]
MELILGRTEAVQEATTLQQVKAFWKFKIIAAWRSYAMTSQDATAAAAAASAAILLLLLPHPCPAAAVSDSSRGATQHQLAHRSNGDGDGRERRRPCAAAADLQRGPSPVGAICTYYGDHQERASMHHNLPKLYLVVGQWRTASEA